jgi:hypothetical protein
LLRSPWTVVNDELPLLGLSVGWCARKQVVMTNRLRRADWDTSCRAFAVAAYRELKAIGVTIESTIERNVTRGIYFREPDGNRVERYGDLVGTGCFERLGLLAWGPHDHTIRTRRHL